MCTLQTLFPPLNIAIFRRLAPSCSFENILWEKFRVPSFFDWIFPKWSRQAESTPFWKWAILSEHKMRAPEKNVPSKRCFLLWKSPFSDASPPAVHFFLNIKWKLLEKFVPCKRCFLLWKSPFSDASPPYYLPMFPTNYAHMFPTNYAQTSPNRISPSRNSLCRENRIRGARAARMAGCAE